MGCSFTQGYGLKNPQEDSWPALLANNFNLECVNLSQPGAGNEFISNTVLEYMLTNDTKDCFFIIAYSEYLRMDFCHKSDENLFIHLTPSNMQWIELTKAVYPRYVNHHYFFKKFLLNVIKIQSYCKLHDIDYVMLNGITTVDRKLLDMPDIKNLISKIDLTKYKKFDKINLNLLLTAHGRLPDGHPNESGHIKIAETVTKWIEESDVV